VAREREPEPVATVRYGVACGVSSILLSTLMKTIQMTIDEELLDAVDELSRARRTTRSALIRHALEAELHRERTRIEERRHADGYARRPVAPGEFDAWLDEQDWGA
jgi:Arc/MetJ-type ribon-helix-helix transcriptional regulator